MLLGIEHLQKYAAISRLSGIYIRRAFKPLSCFIICPINTRNHWESTLYGLVMQRKVRGSALSGTTTVRHVLQWWWQVLKLQLAHVKGILVTWRTNPYTLLCWNIEKTLPQGQIELWPPNKSTKAPIKISIMIFHRWIWFLDQ